MMRERADYTEGSLTVMGFLPCGMRQVGTAGTVRTADVPGNPGDSALQEAHRTIDTRPDRRPNRTASAQSRRYTSSRCPRTFSPVSMTVYVPLYRPSRPANLITVPSGNTRGSAATTPSATLVPAAVVRPMQYAVTVNGAGCASGTRGVGHRGRGFAAHPWMMSRAPTVPVKRRRLKA